MSSPKRFLLGLFVFAVLLIPTLATGSTYVVFRYDDLSADQPGVRESNVLRRQIWEAEQDVDTLFEKYGMPYVISIIPKANSKYGGTTSPNDYVSFADDPEKVEFIKRGLRQGRIEVAQHGLSHINHVRAYNRRHRHGEFRERDYESQLKDIEEGKRILTKICGFTDVVSFVPPWHGWDSNTAKALKESGFRVLSSNRFFFSRQFTSGSGITICHLAAVRFLISSKNLLASSMPTFLLLNVILLPSLSQIGHIT